MEVLNLKDGFIMVRFDDGSEAKVKCAPEYVAQYDDGTDFVAEAEAQVLQLEQELAEKQAEAVAIAEFANAVMESERVQRQVEAARVAAGQGADDDESGSETSVASASGDAADSRLDSRAADVKNKKFTGVRLSGCRPVMLTNQQNQNISKIFMSATLAAQFLGCVQSKISVARNKNENVRGWFISDVPASQRKTMEKEFDAGNRAVDAIPIPIPITMPAVAKGRAAKLNGKPRPLRLADLPESRAMSKAVMLTNMFNPTECHVFKSGTQAAFALGVSGSVISVGRNDHSYNCNGWLITDATYVGNDKKRKRPKEDIMAKVDVENPDRPTTDRATAKPVKPKKKRGKRGKGPTAVIHVVNAQSEASFNFATATEAQEFIGLQDMSMWDQVLNNGIECQGFYISSMFDSESEGASEDEASQPTDPLVFSSPKKATWEKAAQMYGMANDSTIIVVPPIKLPPPEPTTKTEELPANLAGVAGHSGQLYTGPQNRAGRGRDYLVVKRKIVLKDASAGSEVQKLRPVVHGTQYDVSSMQREKYLALDPDSEDGYWYVAKILGLRPSGHEDYQYTAYISWPAFDEYDAQWQPYREYDIVPLESLEYYGFERVVGEDIDTPRIAWAYKQNLDTAKESLTIGRPPPPRGPRDLPPRDLVTPGTHGARVGAGDAAAAADNAFPVFDPVVAEEPAPVVQLMDDEVVVLDDPRRVDIGGTIGIAL